MKPHRHTALLLACVAGLALCLGFTAPVAAHAAVSSAVDSFTRTATGSLGAADSGGAWALAGSTSRFSVTSGVGRIATPAAGQLSANLPNTSIRDNDIATTLSVSALPAGGSLYFGLLARHAGSLDYAGRVIVASNGGVRVNLMAGTTSLTSVAVAGVTASASTSLRLRAQVVGASPTTVRVRVWNAATAEPTTWQTSATDSTAALQTAARWASPPTRARA